MSMEAAALIGMGVIAAVALVGLGLALWSVHYYRVDDKQKGALPSH